MTLALWLWELVAAVLFGACVTSLCDARYGEREAAYESLSRYPLLAFPALEKGLNGGSAERAARCRGLLNRSYDVELNARAAWVVVRPDEPDVIGLWAAGAVRERVIRLYFEAFPPHPLYEIWLTGDDLESFAYMVDSLRRFTGN
jgi:hypothetical protein